MLGTQESISEDYDDARDYEAPLNDPRLKYF